MKISPRFVIALVPLLALLIAAPAVGQEAPVDTNVVQPSDQALKGRVDVLLSGIEQVPSEADWAKLGDPAIPVLIQILQDRDAKIVKRGRAAIGLGHFDSDAVKQALRMTLIDASTPGLLLRKSMIALAKLEGAAATQAVSVHLDHRSKRVREQAIKTLGGLRTQQAHELLTARAHTEPSKYLKDLIAAELKKPLKSTTLDPKTTAIKDAPKKEAAQ